MWVDNDVPNWFRHWKISTGRHFQNGHHNTAKIQHCSISTSWIDSRHRKISTGLHFQNGHHNTTKIQHCSISKVAFNLFFKPVVSGRFVRFHNRWIIIISCWIYTYLCNQCLLSLMWVRILIREGCTKLCDKVYQWLATGWWFSLGPPVSSTSKTDRHDIAEILSKVALNTIKQTNNKYMTAQIIFFVGKYGGMHLMLIDWHDLRQMMICS